MIAGRREAAYTTRAEWGRAKLPLEKIAPVEEEPIDSRRVTRYSFSGWQRGVGETKRAKEGTMAKAMTKSQIVGRIADKAKITKSTAAAVLDELASMAAKEAKNGFTLPGIGKVVLVNRKARMGRNPQTGQPIKIPAKRVVRIRIAKALKDAILGRK